jgi:tetratricopeptide (TPR) repeat protein
MIVLCFRYRARAPLVSYGILAFLLLLAPTSSVVPIRDAMAERRVYLPIFGLCLAAAAALAYSKLSVRVLKWITLAVLFLAGSLTCARSYVWADELVFWTDVTRKSDQNGRAFQAVARALSIRGRYADAIANYEKALTLPADPESRTVVQLSLASTYALNHQPDKARAVLAKMNTSDEGAQLSSQLGVIAARAGDGATAMRDFDRAIQLAPNLEPAYKYRGLVEESLDRNKEAEADFRRAVSLDSSDTEAAAALRELAARQ